MTATHARLYRLTLSALLGALLYVSQIVLAGLPNIELVSLLILVWTRSFRFGALPGIAVFVLLEGVTYSFSIWWVSYIYIWFVLWGLVMLVPRARQVHPVLSALGWATLSGAYGFAFGALTAIPWFFRGGFPTMLAYWISGIPFDITHAVGNFFAAFFLAVPLIRLLKRLKKA